MMSNDVISEAEMIQADELIPEVAVEAMRQAYERALATRGRVIAVRDDNLVEILADGEVRIIRPVATPSRPVEKGSKILLKRNSE